MNAAHGAVVVLAGGALFAGEGAIGEILDGYSYPYFPGFRRYIPAMAFPAFFGLIASIWKLLDRGQWLPQRPIRAGNVLAAGASCVSATRSFRTFTSGPPPRHGWHAWC